MRSTDSKPVQGIGFLMLFA